MAFVFSRNNDGKRGLTKSHEGNHCVSGIPNQHRSSIRRRPLFGHIDVLDRPFRRTLHHGQNFGQSGHEIRLLASNSHSAQMVLDSRRIPRCEVLLHFDDIVFLIPRAWVRIFRMCDNQVERLAP